MTTSQQNGSQTQEDYFNLVTIGCGYFNRLRMVDTESGSYPAVDVCALEGSTSKPKKTYYDANVVGKEAIQVLEAYWDAIANKDNKVFASFHLGGLRVEPFTYQKGTKAGQTGCALKSRLLLIKSLSIKTPESGQYERVYTAPKREADDQSAPAPEHAAQDESGAERSEPIGTPHPIDDQAAWG